MHMKILVVDDYTGRDEDSRNLFKAQISNAGPVVNGDVEAWQRMVEARVTRAGIEIDFLLDGDKAFKHYCGHGPYDLVLTDFAHPGLNGLELSRAIRRKNPAQAITMYTAGIPDPVALFLEELDIPVLYKPVRSAELRQSLHDAIEINRERVARIGPCTVH